MSIRVRDANGAWLTPETYFTAATGSNRLAVAWSSGGTSMLSYTVVVRSYWSDGAFLESSATVRVPVVADEFNTAYTHTGVGWFIAGQQRSRYQADGVMWLTEGDGRVKAFGPADATGVYHGPAGDFSTLQWVNGAGYVRTYPDGSQAVFSSWGEMVAQKDRFGNQTSWNYDGNWVLQSIVDPAGRATTFAYTGGLLTSITDPGGRVTQLAYNAGDLTQITAPDGVVELGAAYDNHHLRSWWNRAAASTTATYDYNDRLAVVLDPQVTLAGGSTVYPRHSFTAWETVVLPRQNMGTQANPSPRIVPANAEMAVSDPRGDTTWLALTSAGNVSRVRDQLGRTSYVTWNAASQPIRTLTSTGHAVTYTWSGLDLVKVWDEVTGDTAHYEYGPYHQPTYSSVPGQKEWRTYDTYGTLRTINDRADTIHATWYTFNPDGRVDKVRDPGGHITHYEYGASTTAYNLADTYSGVSTLRYTRYGYDSYNRVRTVTSPQGDTTHTDYDLINRVTRTVNAIGGVTTYTNGAIGVDSLTDPKGQGYRFYRNALGWATGEKDPLGWTTSYAYDASGNVVSQTDRNGKTITATYDALNRVASRTADGATTYWRYDPNERWAVVQNAVSTDSVVFDLAGRATSTTTTRGTHTYTVANTYTGGHRTLMTATGPWTGSRTVRYHYTALAQLDSLTDIGGGVTSLNYDSEGLLVSTLLANNLGVNQSYTSAHLNSLTQYTNGITSLGGGYALNQNGLVSRWRNVNADTVRDFTYDRLGRLTNATDSEVLATNWTCPGNKSLSYTDPDTGTCTPLGSLGTLVSETFTYDAVGNRTDMSASIGTGNRLYNFNGYSFGYDGEGNQTRKAKLGTEVKNYTWNSLGQLVSVRDTTAGTTTYAYDGNGTRVRKIAPNGTVTEYLYDGDDLLMELDANGSPLAEYTYYPGVDNPHSVRRGGNMYYYATDNVGNVTGLTNASRQVVNLYQRDPWGFVYYAQEGVTNTLGFMGREYDPDTKLYNFRARWYDSQTGRFISQDPSGLAGGINLYAFVDNNPVNFTDPSGLCVTLKQGDTATSKEIARAKKEGWCSVAPGVTGTAHTDPPHWPCSNMRNADFQCTITSRWLGGKAVIAETRTDRAMSVMQPCRQPYSPLPRTLLHRCSGTKACGCYGTTADHWCSRR